MFSGDPASLERVLLSVRSKDGCRLSHSLNSRKLEGRATATHARRTSYCQARTCKCLVTKSVSKLSHVPKFQHQMVQHPMHSAHTLPIHVSTSVAQHSSAAPGAFQSPLASPSAVTKEDDFGDFAAFQSSGFQPHQQSGQPAPSLAAPQQPSISQTSTVQNHPPLAQTVPPAHKSEGELSTGISNINNILLPR